MAASTKVNGLITTWRVTATMCGTMDAAMRASTKTIRSMASVSIHGLTGAATRAIGGRANSTVSVLTLFQRKTK